MAGDGQSWERFPVKPGMTGVVLRPKAGMTGERMTRVISGVRSGVAVGPFEGPTGRFGWVFLARRYCEGTYGKVGKGEIRYFKDYS